MKIAIAQQNYHVGNFEANTRKILEGIEQAKTANTKATVKTDFISSSLWCAEIAQGCSLAQAGYLYKPGNKDS